MRYFPQLETGTAGQYPLRRERFERIVRHEALDGRVRSFYDEAGGRVEWIFHYSGLADTERQRIEDLFAECEGRLQTFAFLDPAANLLRWSEKLTESAWTRGPMLTVSEGVSDPWGTTRAAHLTNTGGADQSVAQIVEAPGSMQYCLSAYVRGTGSPVRLRVDSGGVVIEKVFQTTAEWRRVSVAALPGTNAETVTASLLVAPGGQVDVCGIQLDAQSAPGGYQRTTSRAGIYPNARFAEDEMAWTQQAPNDNAARIRIVSRPY